MTTPSDEGHHELADMPQLLELQATDALLDRLGARSATEDDLLDPVIGELARLAEYADASLTAPPDLDRLIEVLGGRPLYMFDHRSAASTDAGQPIQLDSGRGARRMIDLSDSASRSTGRNLLDDDLLDDEFLDDEVLAGATGQSPGVAARAAREQASGVPSLALIRSLRAGRFPPAARGAGLRGLAHQMALPAASIIAIALLGGGVTAVVAGDPMAPINGVQRIASQFPGLGDGGSQDKVEAVESYLDRANSAAKSNEVEQASGFLKSAQSKLNAPGVPAKEKPRLQAAISDLQNDLQTPAASPPPTPGATPTVAASGTPAPSVSVTSTPVPSSTPSAPSPTQPVASASVTVPPAPPATDAAAPNT